MYTLFQNLRSFIILRFFLEVFGFLNLKQKEKLIDKVFFQFRLLCVIVIFGSTIFEKRNYIFKDSIVIFCQFIDRFVVNGAIFLISIESFCFRKLHFKIFKILSEIDLILINNFEIQINYRKDLAIICLIFSLVFTNILPFIPRILKGGFSVYFFSVFFFSATLLAIIEAFYIALVLQIYRRFLLVEKKCFPISLDSYHKVEEILLLNNSAINVINDNFGASILIVISKEKTYAFANIFP